MINLVLTALFLFPGGDGEPVTDEPVTRTFRSTNLINTRSVDQLFAGTWEFRVGHRFGDAYTGLYDMFGLDLGASVSFGIDAALSDDWMVGVSRSNTLKTWDFHTQYRLMSQTTSGSKPVSVSLYGQWDQSLLKSAETTHLMASVLIARKWTRDFSTQIAPVIIQRLRTAKSETDAQPMWGVTATAHYLLTKTVGVMVEWTPMFNRDAYNTNSAQRLAWDAVSVGVNFEVAGHSFQILASNSNQISTIRSVLGSDRDWTDKHFFLGFNLTRLYTWESPL
ncbi:MAG: hypothetical protein HUU10_00715 [Bacteroidetes bacterium]|nr:hypothetical protein [Bacteroidota bacterium]